MKIFLICSKRFYGKIPAIKKELESSDHKITLPNCYDTPNTEDKFRSLGHDAHSEWKSSMINHSVNVVENVDSVLVLNFEKAGQSNYIGGATFLEMYDAFRLGKKIYLFNDIPSGILYDEIVGFNPVILNGDLNLV